MVPPLSTRRFGRQGGSLRLLRTPCPMSAASPATMSRRALHPAGTDTPLCDLHTSGSDPTSTLLIMGYFSAWSLFMSQPGTKPSTWRISAFRHSICQSLDVRRLTAITALLLLRNPFTKTRETLKTGGRRALLDTKHGRQEG